MTQTAPDPARQRTLNRDRWALSALGAYAQLSVSLALYVYGAVSTLGYASVLLSAPLGLLTGWLLKKGLSRRSVPRALHFIPALVSLTDAFLSFYALCALTADVMPDTSLLGAALFFALVMGCGLMNLSPFALPRLGKLMLWVLTPLFLACAFCALPHGKAGHLFPLLGFGGGSILRGTVFLSGAWAGSCCQLMEDESVPSPVHFPPLLLSLLAGAVTALVSAFLMPVYALAAPRTVGWRLLLVAHMTPSVPCWSLAVWAVALLLLLSLSRSLRFFSLYLTRTLGKKEISGYPALLLLLLSAPLCALQGERLREALVLLSPLRLPLLLLMGFLLLLLPAKRKEGA